MPPENLAQHVDHLECFSGGAAGESVTLAFKQAGLVVQSLDIQMGAYADGCIFPFLPWVRND